MKSNKELLDNLLITDATLILLGYNYNQTFNFYCPPSPANGSTYRIELKAVVYTGNDPVEGTEEWRAYLPYDNYPTIRRFKTLGALNDFHKGMCGKFLYY
jgi:hypothetical protein